MLQKAIFVLTKITTFMKIIIFAYSSVVKDTSAYNITVKVCKYI